MKQLLHALGVPICCLLCLSLYGQAGTWTINFDQENASFWEVSTSAQTSWQIESDPHSLFGSPAISMHNPGTPFSEISILLSELIQLPSTAPDLWLSFHLEADLINPSSIFYLEVSVDDLHWETVYSTQTAVDRWVNISMNSFIGKELAVRLVYMSDGEEEEAVKIHELTVVDKR